MLLIPGEISLRNPSGAETKLFRLLRSVEISDTFALHSLNLAEHEYKVCGEIDFLFAGEAGIFILEVKGGRVACRDGVWIFTDRFDHERRKTEGPFAQASSATFAVLDRLNRILDAGTLRNVPFGWAVAFPDQAFDIASVEWSPEMVLDEADCATAARLEAALKRTFRYWRDKRTHSRPLSASDLKLLRSALRPDFDLVPNLLHRSEDAEATLQSLTISQYRYLDALGNDRILCEGGAGTGKTFLGVEVARRELSAGRRVLVTCSSEILARFIGDQPGLDDPRCTVRALGRLPSVLDEPFDVLVVDEGQDVLNMTDLGTLDRFVKGGLTDGRWRIFFDSNNQSGLIGSFDPDAVAFLCETGPARLHLPDNCRNTRDIVAQVQSVTGADIGVTHAGSGLPVLYRFWDDQDEEASELAEHLVTLLADGVAPEQITILSPKAIENSCVAKLPRRVLGLIQVLDSWTVIKPPKGRIGFSRVREFKGLENRCVCLVDIEAVDGTREAVSTLYVGMTRARAVLWLGLRRDLRSRLGEPRDPPMTTQRLGLEGGLASV